jgi:nucleotide-binding universal stress UspA family protein
MYQRILVATGGSPWSNAAVTYATGLAARTGAELRILTVLTSEASDLADRPTSEEPVLSSLDSESQALLHHAATHAIRMRVVYATHAAQGSIPTAIRQTAEDEDCDLIVMGARRAVGLQRRTLGGIVNAVGAQATQPVMVIKASSNLDRPLGHRILVATGGSPWSEAAVEHALQLAQSLQLELYVLHVEADAVRPGASPRAAEVSSLVSAVTTRAAALGVACEGMQVSGNIPETLVATAIETQCSTMILGSRGVIGWSRPQLGAIVNAVAARTDLPVLVVKHFVSA